MDEGNGPMVTQTVTETMTPYQEAEAALAAAEAREQEYRARYQQTKAALDGARKTLAAVEAALPREAHEIEEYAERVQAARRDVERAELEHRAATELLREATDSMEWARRVIADLQQQARNRYAQFRTAMLQADAIDAEIAKHEDAIKRLRMSRTERVQRARHEAASYAEIGFDLMPYMDTHGRVMLTRLLALLEEERVS